MTTRSLKIRIIANALGFNLAWWGCVLGAKWAMPWLGPAIMAAFLFFHFRFLGHGKREALFILLAGLFGTVVDNLKAGLGLIDYSGGWPGLEWLAPLWITAMWAGFAALLNHSLGWLRERYILAFLLGALFGPPSYLTGVKFDVLHFNLSTLNTVLILAGVWGSALVLMVWGTKALNIGGRHAS